jgi:hypothetical protein
VTTHPLLPGAQPAHLLAREVNSNSTKWQAGQRRAGKRGDPWNRRIGNRASRASLSKSPGSEPGSFGSQRMVEAIPLKLPASPLTNPDSVGPPHFRHASTLDESAIEISAEIDVLYQSPPPILSDEPVPRKVFWWGQQVREFVEWKRE